MRPLENRVGFGLLSLALSAGLMSTLWFASDLPVTAMASVAFLFAVLGLERGIGRLLALALIRHDRRLGDVG